MRVSGELIREFMSGGIVIVDRLPDREEIGFRTFVQPDGDVCLSIHPLALGLPPEQFREQLAEHHRHVTEILAGIRARLRWLATTVGVAFGIMGGAGGLGAGIGFDLTSLVQAIPPEVMLWAAWFVGGVLFGALRGSALRWGLRRLMASAGSDSHLGRRRILATDPPPPPRE